MPKVLIVEDSITQAAQFRGLLESREYEVEVARNGVDALTTMKSGLPDVVLTDLQMPEMNGLELVDAMRLQYPTVPAVLMTAEGSDEIAMEALQHGAADYIPKTQLNRVLFSTIDNVLGLMRADRSYSRLIEQLDYNEFRFTLENDPELIDPLVDLMQQMTISMQLCDPIGRVQIGQALEHALLNALYRGNLEFDRKQIEEQRQDRTDDELSKIVEQRRKEKPYCDRRVHFSAQISTDEARFVVRDEGLGFDTTALPDADAPDLLERDGDHGLVLIRSFMDEVSFDENGNELTMVKMRVLNWDSSESN